MFERARGYVVGVGIAKELTPCDMNASTERLSSILRDNATKDAWEEYKNGCPARPTDHRCPWPLVEGRINYEPRNGLLVDFGLPVGTEPRPEAWYWDPVDHIARFILRVNFQLLQKKNPPAVSFRGPNSDDCDSLDVGVYPVRTRARA